MARHTKMILYRNRNSFSYVRRRPCIISDFEIFLSVLIIIIIYGSNNAFVNRHRLHKTQDFSAEIAMAGKIFVTSFVECRCLLYAVLEFWKMVRKIYLSTGYGLGTIRSNGSALPTTHTGFGWENQRRLIPCTLIFPTRLFVSISSFPQHNHAPPHHDAKPQTRKRPDHATKFERRKRTNVPRNTEACSATFLVGCQARATKNVSHILQADQLRYLVWSTQRSLSSYRESTIASIDRDVPSRISSFVLSADSVGHHVGNFACD